jgi:uncharacterized Tic20 family protein
MEDKRTPTFFFNEWNVPHDWVYAVVFLVTVVPFVIMIRRLYKQIKPKLNSASKELFFLAIAYVLFLVYEALLLALLMTMDNEIVKIICLAIYIAWFFLIFFLPIPLLVIIIYFVSKSIKSQKTKP